MDANALQMLQNLLQAVESKMSGGTDQLLTETEKIFSEAKTALSANDSASDINGALKSDKEQSNQEMKYPSLQKSLSISRCSLASS